MAYLGPTSTFAEIMSIPEGRAVVDQFMPGFVPYYDPNSNMARMSLQRITGSYPPEIGAAFTQAIEQIEYKKFHGGQIMAKALKKEGVDRVFTLAGDHTMPMMYGLQDEGIKVYDFRHESAVVWAAVSYTRETGKPSVVVVTAGPGFSNTIGALIDQWVEGLPVMIITGGHPVSYNETGAMQEIDHLPIIKSITKWSARCYATDRIADYVHIGFRHMTNPADRGPVYLEIPFDVINRSADQVSAYHTGETRVAEDVKIYADPESVKKAAEIIAAAKKPVMVVGREAAIYYDENEYVKKLFNHKMMLAASMFEAKGYLGDESQNPALNLGLIGTSMADLIILLNVNPDYMYTSLNVPAYNPTAKFISINTKPSLIGFNHDIEVGLVGTPNEVCKQLYDEVVKLCEPETDPAFLMEIGQMAQGLGAADAPFANSDASPIYAKRACRDIGAFLSENPDWTLVGDGGDAASNIGGALMASRPRQFVFGGRYGGIGYGLPASLGVSIANDMGKTMLVTGDGAFGFFMGEIVTAIGNNMPVVVVMLNDSCWGMIKGMEYYMHPNVLLSHEKAGKYDIALNLPENFRYDKMVEGAGGYGELVTDPNELIPAIKRAEASGKFALINVMIEDITSPGAAGQGTVMYGQEFGLMCDF